MDKSFREKFEKAKDEIIALAQADESFKKRLLKDPHEIIREYGFYVPSNIKISILENTPKKIHFVIPSKDLKEEISEEELEKLHAAGKFCCSN